MVSIKNKINHVLVGSLIGLLVPLLMLFILFQFEKLGYDFLTFLKNVFLYKTLGVFLKIAVIANLLFFLLFYNLKWDRCSKGILGATILYGIFIMYLYFT